MSSLLLTVFLRYVSQHAELPATTINFLLLPPLHEMDVVLHDWVGLLS